MIVEARSVASWTASQCGGASSTRTTPRCTLPRALSVRRAAWRLIRWKWFDRIVIAAIFINCAFLAMYDPLSPADSSWNRMLDLAELAFTFFFAVEFLVQIVARNFLIGPGAYLKNPWFALDFVIVITGLISFFAVLVGMSGGGNVSGIRTLRTLRPLKTITGFPGMQVIVSTILDSVKLVASALVLLVWLFFIFGVVGIDQYAGKLTHRCYSDPGGIALVQEETNSAIPSGSSLGSPAEFCLNSGEAPNHGYTNFDDIAWSSLTVFQTLTRRGWWHVMEQLEDATGNAVVAKLFFTLVAFGSLQGHSSTGVIAAEYAKVRCSKKRRGRGGVKEMRLMFRRLNRTPVRQDEAFLRRAVDVPATASSAGGHPRFDTFVTLLILVSTAAMAAEHHGMDPEHASLLETAYTLLSLAFALEMVLKLIGLGVVEYSSDRFNRFDAFIVVVGLVELAGAGAGISALRALRLLRVLRSLKILRRFRRMRVLMENVARGVGAMRDFLLVLFLFLFIFTILGMQLFGGSDGFAGERKNFDSFWNSFLIVFEVLTASDWQKVMWRAMRGTGAAGRCAFRRWIFVGHFIFLDLLLAILTFNFSRETEDERLEREEREHLETETTGGEKRGSTRPQGRRSGDGSHDPQEPQVCRSGGRHAPRACETDQMYGDDPISDTDSDDDAAEEKGFDAKRASWKSWRTSTTTTRQRETTTITTTPTTAPTKSRSTSIAWTPARASRPRLRAASPSQPRGINSRRRRETPYACTGARGRWTRSEKRRGRRCWRSVSRGIGGTRARTRTRRRPRRTATHSTSTRWTSRVSMGKRSRTRCFAATR